MAVDLLSAHQELRKWCLAQGLAGYDPFDGLNSRLFQSTPLKHYRWARLAWTQFHKRSPINFRRLVSIPRERNSKAIALFALAAMSEYRREPNKENEIDAKELIDDLIWSSLKGFKGACWGYNFDWQSRSFFAPRGTPAIVPTAFAARALCEAAELFGPADYLPFARTICDFILNDLNRSAESADEVCFSYTPLDSTRVFNASLLAGEVLATVGRLTGEPSLIDWAIRAALYVVRRQRADGSWGYGADDYQSWSDNFHTAYILMSLSRITSKRDRVSEPRAVATGSEDLAAFRHDPVATAGGSGARSVTTRAHDGFENALYRGCEFWRERFFLTNGWPKYFPERLYPADIHSAASAIVTLTELRGRIPGTLILAEQVANWAIENLLDPRGFFYYQRRRFYKVRTPYMRWSQAWMMYALAQLLECQNPER